MIVDWNLAQQAHPGITPIALVGFALAQSFALNPAANRRVVLRSIRANRSVRLSFAVEHAQALRIAVVDDANNHTSKTFQRALLRSVQDAQRGVGALATATKIAERVPTFVSAPAIWLGSLVTAGMGIGLFGIPGAPFGAALISSVERFGLPAVDVPFVPFTRCAMVCSVGAIQPTPIVRNDSLAVIDALSVRVSFDHRICDGAQLAHLLRDFLASCYAGTDPLSA